jgi:hypothetical protein
MAANCGDVLRYHCLHHGNEWNLSVGYGIIYIGKHTRITSCSELILGFCVCVFG